MIATWGLMMQSLFVCCYLPLPLRFWQLRPPKGSSLQTNQQQPPSHSCGVGSGPLSPFGMASPCENAPPVNTSYLYGGDGLGNRGMEVSRLQNSSDSEKLIIDCVRAHPDEVSVVCLGPLTNLAKAFRRDPALPTMVDLSLIHI